jgi:hypothetical protein
VTFNQVIQFEPNEVEKQVSSKRKSILLYW